MSLRWYFRRLSSLSKSEVFSLNDLHSVLAERHHFWESFSERTKLVRNLRSFVINILQVLDTSALNYVVIDGISFYIFCVAIVSSTVTECSPAIEAMRPCHQSSLIRCLCFSILKCAKLSQVITSACPCLGGYATVWTQWKKSIRPLFDASPMSQLYVLLSKSVVKNCPLRAAGPS